MSHDPADTLSNHLPSLPPAERVRSGLDALDPRFPIELGDHPRSFFWTTLRMAGRAGYSDLLEKETRRATQHDAVATVRYVQPLHDTRPMPAITAPAVYPELAEDTLTHEWDTGPGTVILTVDGERGRHRLRGAGGRFVSAGGA